MNIKEYISNKIFHSFIYLAPVSTINGTRLYVYMYLYIYVYLHTCIYIFYNLLALAKDNK